MNLFTSRCMLRNNPIEYAVAKFYSFSSKHLLIHSISIDYCTSYYDGTY